MLGKLYPIIAKYIRKIQSKKGLDHYLRKSIQNEFINLLKSSVYKTIL